MIPDFITHYHLPDREPFLTLSELEGDITHPVFLEMLNKHRTELGYNRRYGKRYLQWRKDAEEKLRRIFEGRGGRIKREHPAYFVLGTSKWFKNLNSQHREIRIPLSQLPRESVSVTFPDSFIAMTAKDKDYFEKVYFIDELDVLISRHGLPKDEVPETYENYWVGDFELFIEVQVWDSLPLDCFRRKNCAD